MVSSAEIGYSASPFTSKDGGSTPLDSRNSVRTFVFSEMTLERVMSRLEDAIMAMGLITGRARERERKLVVLLVFQYAGARRTLVYLYSWDGGSLC